DEACAVFEPQEHGADVGDGRVPAVSELDLTVLENFELELQARVLGDAEKHGAGVSERGDLYRRKRRLAWIAELQLGKHESHASSLSRMACRCDSDLSPDEPDSPAKPKYRTLGSARCGRNVGRVKRRGAARA